MKNIIESVLVKHLGKYIDGLKNSLDIGLLDGQVTIQNVSLKSSFINQLGLPFTLKFSHIERIHINIPWTNLKEKSTVVTVKGIYVLLNISYEQIEDENDPAELLKGMIQRIKMQMKKKWTESVGKQQTFAEKNLIRIVDNAIININNIHVRLESFKRNWDYSLGVIMDDISSYTVDQYEQKSFYHRSFSKKETNKLFKKILNIQKFQIYFNDDETVFMCNELHNGHNYMIRMMAHPFPSREDNIKSPNKKKSLQDLRPYPPYTTKTMTNISLSVVGSQKFAEDMRYIVELFATINTIDMKISDKQLSQMIYCAQHFYEYGLNILKNGKKGYNFNEQIQKFYKITITKIAKEQKITKQQLGQLQVILHDVPMSVLQAINDQIINNVRFEAEMKKISKVMNAQKSKKMMQELLQKKEKLDAMEGVEIFKQVVIEARIDRVLIGLNNSNIPIAEFGIIGIFLNVEMNLQGVITINTRFINFIIKANGQEITKDGSLARNPQFLALNVELNKGLKKLHLNIEKKEIFFSEPSLLSLIDWISKIKIRPSLLNYIEELLNYSIDITRVMMSFLFAKDREIMLIIGIPILNLQLNSEAFLKLDMGQLVGQSLQNNSKFSLTFKQPIQLYTNEFLLLKVQEGSIIGLVDKIDKVNNFEQVNISLKPIHIQNVDKVIRSAYSLQGSNFLNKYSNLSLIDQTLEEQLEGEFYLNKIKPKLHIFISRTGLRFKSTESDLDLSDQNISLLRTRIYKLVIDNRYFIVFKEEVDKQVNLIEASNAKVMETIFIKLKDYIQEICTAFQWEKYFQQIYKQSIQTLEEIQDVNLDNDILMKLNVHMSKIQFDISPKAHLSLENTNTDITYKDFNTQAAVSLKKVDFIIEGEKIIYDASFKASYNYLQWMIIQFQVCKLSYNIKLFSTFSNIIALASQYQLLFFSLRTKNPKKRVIIEEDENRLANIKSQHNRTDNINKFLLESVISIETINIEGQIIGYRNCLKYIKFESLKYRNELHPQFYLDLKGILLFSMVQLPSITIKFTPTQLELKVDSINAQINMAIIIYQIVKGQGSLIIRQVIKALKNRQIARHELKEQQKQIQPVPQKSVVVRRQISIKIEQVRIQLTFTGNLCIGVNSKDIQLEQGRLSWMNTLFWLNNECISMSQINGILKWNHKNIDLCMTNFKLKLNSKEILFLTNELYKIYKFLKLNNFDVIRFFQKQIENPDEKGRVLAESTKIVNIRIQELEIIYECGDKNPLVSIRVKPLFLTTQGNVNTINFSIWHLNRSLKLYEPIIEPFEVRIIERKDTSQIECLLEELYIILTQEFIIDTLNEVKLLQEIQNEFAKDESNQLEEMGKEEVESNKEQMLEQHYEYYRAPDFQQNLEYSFVLKITNYLSCKMVVEVSCSRRQKQQLFYENQQLNVGQVKSINIPQKTSYNNSYQLIERYQKVQLKLCLVNHCYAIRTAFVSFLLYDQDNYYIEPVMIVDSNGLEINTYLAVKVTYCEGIYLVDIMSTYSIQSKIDIPLYFRYSDFYSINKFVMNKNEQVLLPLWVVDILSFGFQENQYTHMLQLEGKDADKAQTGSFQLSFKRNDSSYINLVLHKQKIVHQVKEKPKLNYLKQKSKDEKMIAEFNHLRKGSAQIKQVEIQKKKKELEKPVAAIFRYKIIPGVLVINHIKFPLNVNGKLVDFEETVELHNLYKDGEKQYIKIGLGQCNIHQIFLPNINEPSQINLKLAQQNFVTLIVHLRRNKSCQRIIHIYAQIHLIFNVPNLHQPTLITNIYQHNFIIKKEVKNGHSDKIHPSPILKDKFVFNTYHYLLNLQEKYVSAKMNNCTSNQIILYHSDFDKDMKFKLAQDAVEIENVYAVSYENRLVALQTDEEGRKPQILECCYTYIMPKYYLINRSDGTLVVDGNHIIRGGEKIALNNIKYVDLNIRDQLQFKYISKSLTDTNSIMFVRGKEEDIHSHHGDIDSEERLKEVHEHFNNLETLRDITEVTEQSTSRFDLQSSRRDEFPQRNIRKQELQQIVHSEKGSKDSRSSGNSKKMKVTVERLSKKAMQISEADQYSDESDSSLKGYKHIVQMDDIRIFSISKRICDYNTISYEINDWSEWLTIKNDLSMPVLIRVKLHEDIAGVVGILGGKSEKIISGLSEEIEIVLVCDGDEVILGRFSLAQRLNHNVFLKGCDYNEIIMKQNKVKSGRFMLITCPQKLKDQGVYKVINSLHFAVKKISFSLVLQQDKIRRELIRVNLNDLKLMLLNYKNGLYMLHLAFQNVSGLFKRVPFLILKEFKGYLEGFKEEFIERLAIQIAETLQITLSDDLIVSLMGQLQIFEKHIPSTTKLNAEQIISQEEETYHINSLGIKGIEIKLCMRKIISDMTEQKSRLLSKLSLSMVEVEDAEIHLSPIEIEQPLRQKHINGISKMYTMESFVGVASGLNILGNPAQFANEFQAGRNKGGVLPFFRSIVAGTTNSVSKIIGTIGSSVSQLTFDREFMKHRIHNKNIKAENFGMGLKIGLREFAHSIKSGFTGLVEQPLQGHRQQGGMGVLKGAVAGFTGLLTKPLTGFIFAASKTIEGINSSTTYLDYKILQRQQLITRPLYHKFKLVRPYKSEDELAYNILLNWYEYSDVELIGGYLLQNEQGDSIVEILIITCSQLILIDLNQKEVVLKLRIEQLLATGKFVEGVVLYFQEEDDQDEIVFRLRNDPVAKENLYWTLKGFIGLYAQEQ